MITLILGARTHTVPMGRLLKIYGMVLYKLTGTHDISLMFPATSVLMTVLDVIVMYLIMAPLGGFMRVFS